MMNKKFSYYEFALFIILKYMILSKEIYESTTHLNNPSNKEDIFFPRIKGENSMRFYIDFT